MRKIIRHTETRDSVTALCDDGSMWSIADGGQRWVAWPPIPQPATPAPPAAPTVTDAMADAALDIWFGSLSWRRPSAEAFYRREMRAALEAALAAQPCSTKESA